MKEYFYIKIKSLLLILFLLSNLTLSAQVQLDAKSNGYFKVDVLKIDIRKVKQRENSLRIAQLSPDNESIWGRISCEYTISQVNKSQGRAYSKNEFTWLDECIFSWRVLLARGHVKGGPAEEAKSKLLEKKISYRNIKVMDRQKHHAVVYIEPSVLRRYGDLLVKRGIVVQLQIMVNDKVLTTSWANTNEMVNREEAPRELFPENSQADWFYSETINQLDYGLVTRFETPWAWSSYKSYEFIAK